MRTCMLTRVCVFRIEVVRVGEPLVSCHEATEEL